MPPPVSCMPAQTPARPYGQAREPALFWCKHCGCGGAVRRIGLILLLLAVAGGVWWWAPWRGEPQAPPETAVVERGDLRVTVGALGTLQPLQFVDVGTQVTGQLRKLHVLIGQAVKKGDLIAEIDPTLFESRVGQTSAQISNSQALLADRKAQLALARLRVERNRTLMGSDAVSRQELEASEAAFEQAAAGVKVVEAQIRQQSAALNFDSTNLRYTKIYAPMDGTVVSLTARQGQTLVAAQQAPVILRIADLGTMTVQAEVSEADISRLKVGTPASFNTLGLPDRRWTGAVRQVLPTPETLNNVVLYKVLFDVENPDGVLLPQMSAQVSFLLKEVKGVILAPTRALLPGRPHRVKVMEQGKPVERKIKLGLETRKAVEVLEGLREGETLVLPAAKSEGGRGGKGKGGKGGGGGGGPKSRPH
ncbi:MAG: efflux RND transporter periplasmic adaptor subunit [Betaproteobacteria bacterium]|nr:efflux RND transporter periplasmic adaptor subunit [Betaproteobacteria bacterium]